MKRNGSNIGSKGKLNSGSVQGKTGKDTQTLKLVTKVNGKPQQANCKPLYGKVFYLDLPSNVVSENLEKDIKEFGGTVEGFLSKDISYLISNKKEAKFARTLRQFSPEASPESAQNAGNSSPPPNSKKLSLDGSLQKTSETVRISRGKSLVEKVIKEQEIIPSNSILSSALSWGVKVIHIDDIKCYIEQKKKECTDIKKPVPLVKDVGKGCISQKTKSGRLKKPFVKVEDRSRHYRPLYLQLSSFPVINYSIAKTCSPFDLDKKISAGPKHNQATIRNKINTERESETQVQLNFKEKKKKGYCECCLKKYEDLQSHLESEQHRTFAESAHYQVVDDMISKFVFDFVECRNDKNKRKKCSTGDIVPVETVLRKDQLEERLKKMHPLNQQHSCNMTPISSMQEFKSDERPTESLNSSLQKPVFIAEPACSLSFYHSSFTSEVINEPVNSKPQNLGNADGMIVISNCVKLLPPQRDDRGCMEKLPKACEHYSDEHKTHIDDTFLQGLQAEMKGCTSSTQALVTGFNETQKKTPKFVSRLSFLKRKIDGSLIFPTKCWKIHDFVPVVDKIPDDFRLEKYHLEENCTIHELGKDLNSPPVKDVPFIFPANELKTPDFEPVVGEILNSFRLEDHHLEQSCTVQELGQLLQHSPRKDDLFIFPKKSLKTSHFDAVYKIPDCLRLETHPLEESCINNKTGQLLHNPLEESCTNQETRQLLHNPTVKEQTCDISSTDSLPSGKLQRKVKVFSLRNKRGNQKQNVDLCCKQANEMAAKQEDSVAISSSIESLLELFQTSEAHSDFLGFTSYSGRDGPSCPNDYWEEQSSVTPWSLFGHSSSSGSSFLDLCCKQVETAAKQEDSVAISSSLKSLLELFQTSEAHSDFLGFTSYSGRDGPSCPNDYWEEQSSSTPWSLFGHSSSSGSSFLGF